MKNKFRKKLVSKRHEKFEKNLKKYYDLFDKKYPGWRESKDADYIKKQLEDTARKNTKNILKKKTKVIEKKDFKEWPFMRDRVILVQTSRLMISLLIDCREYALNGLAHTGLNIPFAHDAGKVIMGKSVSEFIKIGREL